jgi:hypothetical protein
MGFNFLNLTGFKPRIINGKKGAEVYTYSKMFANKSANMSKKNFIKTINTGMKNTKF